MAGFFEELEAQLHDAARAQIALGRVTRRGGRGWWRSTARAVPVALALVAAAVVAGVAVFLIPHGHPGGSPGGSPPPASGPPAPLQLNRTQRQVIDYVEKAEGTAYQRDQACFGDPARLGDPARKPSLSQGSPPAALLRIIAVLRRPAVPSDRLPPRIVGRPPRVYPNGTIPPVKGVYIRYVRKARHRFGANYYLAPAQNVNWRTPVPARCYREQEVALRAELPRIPRRLRSVALALEPRYIAYQRASTRPYPGVCLLALNDTGNGDGGCGGYSVSEIEQGHTLTSGGPTGVGVVYGLAPDGVRSVTFYYRARHPLTALVIDNVFILHNPGQRLPNYGFPYKLVWHAADGAVIKTVTGG